MLTVIERVLLLQDIDLFRFAYTEHLSELASVCQEKQVDRNSTLFRRGQPCSTLFLLVEGRVSLRVDKVELETVQQSGLDHWSFFAHQNHLYDAEALDDCTLLTVSFEEMADLMTAEPEFCWAVAQHLAHSGRDLVSGAWERMRSAGQDPKGGSP